MHKHPVSMASTPWNLLLAVHGSQEASRPGTATGTCWATSGTHTGSGGSEGIHGALTTSAVLVSAVLWLPLPSVSTPPGSGAAIVCPPFCSTPQKIQFKADLSNRNRNSGRRELLTKKNQRFPWVIKQDRDPASNSGSEEDGRGPPGRGRLPALMGKQLSWTPLLPWEPAGAPRQTTGQRSSLTPK